MRIGLIGGGNIGRFLLQSINIDGLVPGCRIVGLYTRNQQTAEQLAQQFHTENYVDIESFIQSSTFDLIVEAATVQVVKDCAAAIIGSGKDLVLSSVGALAEQDFYHKLEEICFKNNSKIYLPSGAIGGLDVLKAAKSVGGLDSVSIITRKPPHALSDVPADKEQVVFKGSANEAIELFPKNINVSIILSLAGVGPDLTDVTIISDPSVSKNSHTIEATGLFGKLSLKVENDPMPNNPKTSYLAALSVLSTLRNIDSVVKVG